MTPRWISLGFCLFTTAALAQDAAALFGKNCAVCHESGQAGAPSMKDGSWIWGGRTEDLRRTIAHGVRAGDDAETRKGEMPAFGADALLEKKEIEDVAEFVLSLRRRSKDAAAIERGAAIFSDNCAQCHGPHGEGSAAFGAPALTGKMRLQGDGKSGLIAQITQPAYGTMPAWQGLLDAASIDALARYVQTRNRKP